MGNIRSSQLAICLRTNIDSFIKKIPVEETGKAHTWDTLVQYIGRTFDDTQNRKLAIQGNGFTKTIHQILRGNRIEILVKALKEYNSDDYKDF